MAKKRSNLYFISVLLFMLALPTICIIVQAHNLHIPYTWQLIGKWFLFWSIGIRLFIAGIKQIVQPEFTAKQIFQFKSEESFVVIRELGFANVSIGLLGMLSLVKPLWSAPAAIAGGLYFGLAGLSHLLKKPETKNEVIAMISDIFIFLLMLLYLIFTL